MLNLCHWNVGWRNANDYTGSARAAILGGKRFSGGKKIISAWHLVNFQLSIPEQITAIPRSIAVVPLSGF